MTSVPWTHRPRSTRPVPIPAGCAALTLVVAVVLAGCGSQDTTEPSSVPSPAPSSVSAPSPNGEASTRPPLGSPAQPASRPATLTQSAAGGLMTSIPADFPLDLGWDRSRDTFVYPPEEVSDLAQCSIGGMDDDPSSAMLIATALAKTGRRAEQERRCLELYPDIATARAVFDRVTKAATGSVEIGVPTVPDRLRSESATASFKHYVLYRAGNALLSASGKDRAGVAASSYRLYTEHLCVFTTAGCGRAPSAPGMPRVTGTTIPDDFPLATGWLWAPGGSPRAAGTTADYLPEAPIFCGRKLAPTAPADLRVVLTASPNETAGMRALVLYPDQATAKRDVARLVGVARECPAEPGIRHEVISWDADSPGWLALSTFDDDNDRPTQTRLWITRVGRAALLTSIYGTGSGEPVPAAREANGFVTGEQGVVRAMCVFTDTGC